MTDTFIILCFQLKSGQNQFTQNMTKHRDFYILIFYILGFIRFLKKNTSNLYLISIYKVILWKMFSPRLDVRLKAEDQYKKHLCPGRLMGEIKEWAENWQGCS